MLEDLGINDLGLKGMPGMKGYPNELALVEGVINELSRHLERPAEPYMDGYNPHVSVDYYTLCQAVDALKHYRRLVRQHMEKLVSPYSFHSDG